MTLTEYFEKARGRGVLATADSEGKVNGAVYSRPHFVDEETVAYIMTDRLTHSNLRSNPHAAYIFMQTGEKLTGKRLYLTKVKEDSDPGTIKNMRWRKGYVIPEDQENQTRFLVYFHVDMVLPLIGTKE
jgi:hypothetical protein